MEEVRLRALGAYVGVTVSFDFYHREPSADRIASSKGRFHISIQDNQFPS